MISIGEHRMLSSRLLRTIDMTSTSAVARPASSNFASRDRIGDAAIMDGRVYLRTILFFILEAVFVKSENDVRRRDRSASSTRHKRRSDTGVSPSCWYKREMTFKKCK
jgi:hypothetical protein